MIDKAMLAELGKKVALEAIKELWPTLRGELRDLFVGAESKEVGRLRDMYVEVERNCRLPNGDCFFCGHPNQYPWHRPVNPNVPGSGCLFRRHPREG